MKIQDIDFITKYPLENKIVDEIKSATSYLDILMQEKRKQLKASQAPVVVTSCADVDYVIIEHNDHKLSIYRVPKGIFAEPSCDTITDGDLIK